jgi:hypothetical protein
MLVRLFVTIFNGTNAVLFGRIGFLTDDGTFISHESKRIVSFSPLVAVQSVVRAYKDGFFPPEVTIDGTRFAIDLTEIETQFV